MILFLYVHVAHLVLVILPATSSFSPGDGPASCVLPRRPFFRTVPGVLYVVPLQAAPVPDSWIWQTVDIFVA